jgi:hypothetical protein
MARSSSKGRCTYCQKDFSFQMMLKHLPACAERLALIAKVEKKTGARETLYHLRVQSLNCKAFWLDLEVRGSATLNQLDGYLRAIWLECCGHLSHFAFGGWQGEELEMKKKISAVFETKEALTHLYDYGTTSMTTIHATGKRKGKPTSRHPIALMARNLQPEAECTVCHKPASLLCEECLIEEGVWGTLCEAHAKEHEHDNYGDPIPLVNSPRLGLCGYTGPADPPY